jgi:L-threonylcarbamoyladenylate synthase
VIPFRTSDEIAAAISAVVTHLSRRGVIGYPTETIYGFGSAVSGAAVTRLAALKGRAPGKPFLLLVASREMIAQVGLRLTDAGERFAAAFWPGPLTLVLPGGERELPDVLRGPEGGIAVRWTSHPGVSRLVSVLGAPVTSTSANRPRELPAATGAEIEATFAAAVRDGSLLVLDAGVLLPSPPSTVVDCTGAAPRLVREGALGTAVLRAVVPALVG